MLFSLIGQITDLLSVVVAVTASCFVSKNAKKKIGSMLLDKFIVEETKPSKKAKKCYAVQVLDFPKQQHTEDSEEKCGASAK